MPGAAQMYRVLYREHATGDGPAMDETMDKIIGASNSPTIAMLCLGCPLVMPTALMPLPGMGILSR